MKKCLVISCLVVLLISSSACRRGSNQNSEIQSKARVFNLTDPDGSGFTSIGIMSAFNPETHSFWWRPTPMIADPGMLERYFERCKFEMDGSRIVNFCVRGNEVVVAVTSVSAPGIEQGLDNAQSQLQQQPGLLMTYHEPADRGFSLQQKAGVDMNTGEGVLPTVVRSAKKTDTGWELDVTCGCGNALITLNNNFDFVALKRT